MSEAPYPFNDDLLLEPEAQKAARRYYPTIFEALYHPELIAVFQPVDRAANAAKRKSRAWGLTAVTLVTLALLLASSGPLFENPRSEGWDHAEPWINLVSGLAGAAGTIIGFFGILFADSKRRWLEGRLATERLRQFHFQSMLALAPDIGEAVRSGDWSAFKARRAAEFRRFQDDVLARIPTVYGTLVTEEAERAPALFPGLMDIETNAGPMIEELSSAYRRLRIERQIQYASYKLQNKPQLVSDLPLSQARLLDNGAMICVLLLVLLHGLIVAGAFSQAMKLSWVHVVAIWLAILGLALRTVEEGMKPHREIERYRDHRSALRNIERKFDDSKMPERKRAAMLDLEVLAYDEMVNFLRSNHDSRFIM